MKISKAKSGISALILPVFLAGFASAVFARNNDAETPVHEEKNPGTVATAFNFYFILYKTFASPVHGKQCIFTPSCSVYAREAIERNGFAAAYPMITGRLLRCNPSAIELENYTVDFSRDGGPCDDPVK